MEDWHLRFGITSNCNFRCSYCNSHNSVSKDMSDKDIKEIIEAAKNNSVKRIHWTGGEPLFKNSICEFMKYAKELGYEEQSMTTNGFFLERKVEELKDSGISRINISLDTMNKEKFKNIVGIDALDKVLKGIDKMLEKTDCLIKINMVVMKDNINEIKDFINFAIEKNKIYGKERIIVRFLQFFPCNPNQLEEDGQNFWVNEYITEVNILNELKKLGTIKEISRKQISGDNPSMRYYRINDTITVGILAMFSWKYPCGSCHKLRISPQGNISVCLNDKNVVKIDNTSLEEKNKIIKNLLQKRENIIEKNIERKHFRSNLGEFRFGKTGKEANIEDFYEMLRKGRGKECSV